MIRVSSKGNFSITRDWLRRNQRGGSKVASAMQKGGRKGVQALASMTPVESGETARAWDFEYSASGGVYKLEWFNTNENAGVNIAIILQYGHGTGTGGYVAGRDYINPAIQPIFDEIASDIWKAVTLG